MPRKITSVTIDNYRSWFGPYEPIKMPKGENLLVYGENGSGKSSFFKGMQNYFRSSIDGNPPFELNIFSVLAGNTNGSISVEFSDFATTPATVTQYQYTLGTASTNKQQFINDTRKLNSFLDYKHMLGVHYTDPDSTTTPDLFSSLVEVILGNYIIPATGNSINEEIRSIEKGLDRRSDSRFYTEAATNFPTIHGAVAQIVRDVILDLNRLLKTYFDNTIEVQILDFRFEIEPNRRKWLIKVLRLQVRYSNEVIPNYNYFLNEARLSAIAICFYLSAVLSHPPAATDTKILFLDDVFIGLDTSNRIPLLKLLKTEFADYQLFITTYDRFWYEISKDWFDKNMKGLWMFREMFVHKAEHITGRTAFDITITVPAETNFAKALNHLDNNAFPDYPAAANYLRKYAEEIFKKYLPESELKKKDENIGEFPEFIMLKELINKARDFYAKIRQNVTTLTLLAGHLKRLLNPLSHYDPATPIYKGELDDLKGLLPLLESELKQLKDSVYKESLNEHRKIRIRFVIAADNFIYFKAKLNDQLYKYQNSAGVVFSDCPIKSLAYYTDSEGGISGETKRLQDYTTLETCYNQLHAFVITLPGCAAIPLEANWCLAFEYENPVEGANPKWLPINALQVWP